MELELITSRRGCEIHQHINGNFHVYEVGESPDTTSAYAVVPTLKEAEMVVDSLFNMYQATSVMDAFMSILPPVPKRAES